MPDRISSVSKDSLNIFFGSAGDYAKSNNSNTKVTSGLVSAVISGEQNINGDTTVYNAGHNPNTPDGDNGVYGLCQITLANGRKLAQQALGLDPNSTGYDDQVKQALADPEKSLKMAATYLQNEENHISANYSKYNLSDADYKAVIAGSYNLGRGANDTAIQASIVNGKFNREAYYQAYFDGLHGVDKTTNNVNRVRRAAGDVSVKDGKYIDNKDKSVQKIDFVKASDAVSSSDQSFLDSNYLTVEKELPSLIIEENTGNTPWYSDPNLKVGNPHLKQIVTPAWFEVNLRQNSSQRLADKNGYPIQTRLNVSLREVQTSMAHIMNNKNTRTGFHITLWGQEPDIIIASGTTGVFMNWFGLTGLMSLAGSMEKNNLSDMLQNNFTNSPRTLTAALNADEKLRVAAQDAFIEMLGLFKNNGITRYHPELINRIFQGKDPNGKSVVGEASWSPATGSSFKQASKRLNDVITRGYVVMRFKNRSYLGYFKTMEFTMDANNPFKWDFSFTFQVEKTLSLSFIPPFFTWGA